MLFIDGTPVTLTQKESYIKLSLHHFRLRRWGGFSGVLSEGRFAIRGFGCSCLMETIRKSFVLKFGCFDNCKEACVFMERVIGNMWWCGEDSAKDSGLKHLDFVDNGDFANFNI